MAKVAATKARSQRHTCPACGTDGSFRAGQPLVCKVCGTSVGGDPPGPLAPLLSTPPSTSFAAPARDEPPTALAAVALACAILAFMTLWVQPVSFFLILAAIICGIVALTRHEGDAGVQVMAGIGVGLAGLALLLIWFVCVGLGGCNGGSSGSSAEFSSSSNSTEGGSGGNDGGGSGGNGGGSSGDGGGGSGGGVDAGGDVAAPMPVGVLGGLGLLAAAAWRRRA